MRIVSLLPSATEIVFALGIGEQLAGVTHECDYPSEALGKPRVTSTALPAAARTSRDIDEGINRLLDEGRSIYHLDLALLEQLQPDLILTQELCDVCAVAYSEVNRAAASVSSQPRVVSLEPNTLEQVLDTILTVGSLCQVESVAKEYVAGLRARLAAIQRAGGRRPRVYCMEWLDPPMRAGHWVPEMVGLAGGEESFGNAGQPSTKTTWDDIATYRPEIVVLMPCGFDLPRTVAEAPLVLDRLAALGAREVWAVNGSAYFSRPGPRLVEGVEILAHILGTYAGGLPTDSVQQVR
ncbi:MAG TPA: cobalamin-binding protein [Chloroflexota bacterium]|nr:cobalamin-binding protein [Chloroflexota bacterium]